MDAQELTPLPPDAVASAASHAVEYNSHPTQGGKLRRGRTPSQRGIVPKKPLHERASIALGGMFGEEVKEVAYCVAESVKRGSMSPLIGRMIIERVLPSSRPIQLDLPEIKGPQDVVEAEGKIVAAMNAGRISPAEARTLQSWAKAAYRARRIANADMGRRV